MTSADKITSLRLVLAPLFFLIYFFPVSMAGDTPLWTFSGGGWVVPVLWGLFIVSEITDLADGKIARARNEVSDFGKLFDPFADVLVRITYFLCFVTDKLLPLFPLLVILYREFGILFIRILMMKKGVAMGARKGGKIKAVSYMAAGILALLAFSVKRLGFSELLFSRLRVAGIVVFVVSTLISLLSFADYVRVYRNARTG
jgi:CDP-diacylglycerol--glycerol-3-phosphate 3-phosphatidyltransferase